MHSVIIESEKNSYEKGMALLAVLLMVLSVSACGNSTDNTEYDDYDYGYESEYSFEETEQAAVNDEAYEAARAAYVDSFEPEEGYEPLMYYFADLNGDGYEDLVIQRFSYPTVEVYNAETESFEQVDTESVVITGSGFRFNPKSDFLIDTDNGICSVKDGK